MSLAKTPANASYSPVASMKMGAYIRLAADTNNDGFRSPLD